MMDKRFYGTVVITGIGKLVSGDFKRGILPADTLVVVDGIIRQIGWARNIDLSAADYVVDVQGQVVCPGFIDAHVHNTIDDYQPMQRVANWMETYLWNGITTLVSEGEQGPGYPRFFDDPIGTKALAIVAHRVFEQFRPGGFQKVHGGALVLVDGFTESDFAELARAGVWLVAEIGGGSLPLGYLEMVGWARQHGFKVSAHIGPRSIPTSSPVGAEIALAIQPDKMARINGGSTAAPWPEIQRIIDQSQAGLELVVTGNQKMADRILAYLKERGELHRVTFGSDTPTGQGITPNGIQRMVMRAAAFHDIAPEQAVAMGTGNTADLYGLNTGKIEVGREADILAIDSALDGVGQNALESMANDDTFGISMVMVDGQICSVKGRDGRPTRRCILINGVPTMAADVNEYIFGPYFPGFLAPKQKAI